MLPTVIAAVAAVVATLTFVGYFIVRFARNSLATQTSELLRQQNDALRQEVVDSEHRCDEKLEAQKKDYDLSLLKLNREIAEVRGRVGAMTPEWAKEIAKHLRDLGVNSS